MPQLLPSRGPSPGAGERCARSGRGDGRARSRPPWERSSYTGPLLVIASTDDPSVDVEQSGLVARSDVPATFVELPGSAHGVALFESEHQAAVEGMIDEFLAASFGG